MSPLVEKREPGSMCSCTCHSIGLITPHMGYPCGCRKRPEPVNLPQLFGDQVIFFPKAPTAPHEPVQWRDPHPCTSCGVLVLLPEAHLKFHWSLEEKK